MIMVVYTRLDTAKECTTTDSDNAVWNNHRGKTAALLESLIADGGHAVGDGDGGQASTHTECITANTNNAVGDGYRGQTTTFIESKINDRCYAVSVTLVNNRFRYHHITRISSVRIIMRSLITNR